MVHARSKTRSARRRSWYFSTRLKAASRVSAMPETMFIVADSSGSRLSDSGWRQSDRARSPHCLIAPRKEISYPSIACGSATVLPRPMNCMRSVS